MDPFTPWILGLVVITWFNTIYIKHKIRRANVYSIDNTNWYYAIISFTQNKQVVTSATNNLPPADAQGSAPEADAGSDPA